MRRLFIVVCIGAVLVGPAYAKELYVNNSGSPACSDGTTYDNNSAASPWCTIGRGAWGSTNRDAMVTTQAAQAGDTVNVTAGTYTAATLSNWQAPDTTESRKAVVYNPANEGVSGSEITFKASGTVVLQTTAFDFSVNTGQPIIGADDRDYIVWDGFYIDEADADTRPDTGPVVVWISNHVTIKNCTIIGVYEAWVDNHPGIRLEGSDDCTIHNNLISRFRFYPDADESHNTVGVQMYDSDRITVSYNTISDCGSGVYVKQANEGPYYIHHNYFYDESRYGIAIQQLTSGEIYQNVVRDSTNGIDIFSYASAYGPDNIDIANNTVDNVAGDQGAIYISSVQYSDNIRVYNNILTNSNRGVSALETLNANLSDAVIEFEHNHYYNNTTIALTASGTYDLASWKSVVGKETETGSGRVGEESDPGYTSVVSDDYILTTGANAESGGVDILDLDNDLSITDAINRGAYITGSEIIGYTVDGDSIVTCYTDGDGDGEGAGTGTSRESCLVGEVTNNLDCDDTDNTFYSTATQVCGNGRNEQTCGVISDDCPSTGTITAYSLTNGDVTRYKLTTEQ